MTDNQRPQLDPSLVVDRRSPASAPGKIILCGEHAVVYGRPAIALPLPDVRAHVAVEPAKTADGFSFSAPDFGRTWLLDAKPDDPLSQLVVEVLAALRVKDVPLLHVTITSAIPIASGMGSGAAVATALVRALAKHFEANLSDELVSALVFANERRLHGTPSGIDNTVVAFEQPIWFERGQGPAEEKKGRVGEGEKDTLPLDRLTAQSLPIASPFTLLIGDSGVRSATKLPVGAVRRHWEAEPVRYEMLFDQVAEIAHAVRDALASGDIAALGPLLDHNHSLLQAIGVSSPELDQLVSAAKAAGAIGAKLSGAGWGGVMLALVKPETQAHVADALRASGATQVLATVVARS